MDVFDTPLLVEPWPGQLSSDARLLPLRQFDQRVGLTRAFTQADDDPGGADLTRVLLSRALAWTSWQQRHAAMTERVALNGNSKRGMRHRRPRSS